MASITQWARYALTSDPGATEPTEAALCLLVAEVRAEVLSEYPCLTESGATTPEAKYASDEEALDAFNRLIGYRVAARYLPTRAGLKHQATSVVVKVGPVTKTYGGPISATNQAAALTERAIAAARLIPCIREAILARRPASEGSTGLFALPGRRRAVGAAQSLSDQAIGE